MADKPKVILMNNDGNISVYSDVPIEIVYLDGFIDGLDEDTLVTVDGEKYQRGMPPDLTISKKLTDNIIAQIESEEDAV